MVKIKKIAILCNGHSSNATDRKELVQQLQEKGIQPYIGGILDDKVNEYYCKNNAIFLPLVASRTNTNPLFEIKSILNVRKQIKKEKIDGVIIYGVKNHPAMAIGSHLGGAKKIMCIVNGSGNLFKLTSLKGKLLRLISFPMLKIAYKVSNYICFQNNDDLKMFKEKKLITKRTKAFITGGSGVNLEKYPYSKLPKENKFLFLARITPTKGIKEYIEAAYIVKEKYPNCTFDIYGNIDSAVENSIEEKVNKAVKDKIVNYHGRTNDVPKALSESRFFIYPSYYPEGVPRCSLQALSSGRPIITCNTPGCKETVKDGINGFIIEPKDSKVLAEKMIYMINNPKEVEKMAKESRALAELTFDVYKINEILIKKIVDEG